MSLPTIVFPLYPSTASLVSSQRQYIQNRPSLITNFNAGGFAETFIEGVAVTLGSDATSYPNVTTTGAYQSLTIIQTAAYILSASGSALDAKAADVGATRKQPTPAGGLVNFSVTNNVTGTAIPIASGTVIAAEVADPTSLPILYVTTGSAYIATGTNIVTGVFVVATTSGAATNQPGGSLNTIVVGPAGVSVTNPIPIAGGNDTESDASLRTRALNMIPGEGFGSSNLGIKNTALQNYPGITYAEIVENVNASGQTQFGTSQLYIDDGSGNLGSSGNVNYPQLVQLQTDLNSGKYRAVGITVQANGSTPVFVSQIALSIFISQSYLANGGTESAVSSGVALAIYNYVNTLGLGQALYLSTIVDVADLVNGVQEVVLNSVTINGNNFDLTVQQFQAARLVSASNVIVTIAGSE